MHLYVHGWLIFVLYVRFVNVEAVAVLLSAYNGFGSGARHEGILHVFVVVSRSSEDGQLQVFVPHSVVQVNEVSHKFQ